MILGPDAFNPDDDYELFTETPEIMFQSEAFDFVVSFDIADLYFYQNVSRNRRKNQFRARQ